MNVTLKKGFAYSTIATGRFVFNDGISLEDYIGAEAEGRANFWISVKALRESFSRGELQELGRVYNVADEAEAKLHERTIGMSIHLTPDQARAIGMSLRAAVVQGLSGNGDDTDLHQRILAAAINTVNTERDEVLARQQDFNRRVIAENEDDGA